MLKILAYRFASTFSCTVDRCKTQHLLANLLKTHLSDLTGFVAQARDITRASLLRGGARIPVHKCLECTGSEWVVLINLLHVQQSYCGWQGFVSQSIGKEEDSCSFSDPLERKSTHASDLYLETSSNKSTFGRIISTDYRKYTPQAIF